MCIRDSDGNVVLTRAKAIEGAPIDQKRMCARGASIPTLIVQELSLIHIRCV